MKVILDGAQKEKAMVRNFIRVIKQKKYIQSFNLFFAILYHFKPKKSPFREAVKQKYCGCSGYQVFFLSSSIVKYKNRFETGNFKDLFKGQSANSYRLPTEVYAFPVKAMQNVSLGSREPDACKYRYLSSDRFKGAFTAAKSEIIKEGSFFF